MTEHILSMLGLALKAGRVEVGEEPVGAAARAKKARVIFVAQDAAPSSMRRAQSFARTGSTLCVTLPADKDALGRSLGRSSVAMCAVTDIGFAESLVRKLAALDSETYQPAADTLAVKARRARERKEERLRHEKNLRQGKKRTHAEKPAEPEPAPPPARPAAKRPPPAQQRPPAAGASQTQSRAARPAVRRLPAGEEGQGQPEAVRQDQTAVTQNFSRPAAGQADH